MIAAEPFTTSSTLVVSTADITAEPTAEFVEVLVEGLIAELIGTLVACVTLNGADGVRVVRDGRKTRAGNAMNIHVVLMLVVDDDLLGG